MTERDKILKGIYDAIDEVNEQLPEGFKNISRPL
jgi:hypothetical protein